MMKARNADFDTAARGRRAGRYREDLWLFSRTGSMPIIGRTAPPDPICSDADQETELVQGDRNRPERPQHWHSPAVRTCRRSNKVRELMARGFRDISVLTRAAAVERVRVSSVRSAWNTTDAAGSKRIEEGGRLRAPFT